MTRKTNSIIIDWLSKFTENQSIQWCQEDIDWFKVMLPKMVGDIE